MKIEKNIFGEGSLYEENDLKEKVYVLCSACMSVYSDILSWANSHPEKIAKTPAEAKSLIVLSCQVTDLAILNDLRKAEKLMADFPGRDYYIGGCLAKRFDVNLTVGLRRLDTLRTDYQPIDRRELVDFDKPFWVPKFEEKDNALADGHLFREMYPLRISVGCSQSCTYCTIRTTRGKPYELETEKLEKEFLSHENGLLIADSPSVKQLTEWCLLAEKHNKPMSIRNIEPHTASEMAADLLRLAERGLLKVFHCPVQSSDAEVLKDMRRSPQKTFGAIDLMRQLKAAGVVTATNIIIDYKNFPNPSLPSGVFDYVSWNPYWAGSWDRKTAEERFARYL